MQTDHQQDHSEMPISRPPWITPKGIALLFFIVLLFCSAYFCASLFEKTISVFLAMSAACAFLLLATSYVETLVLWRQAKLGALNCTFGDDKSTFRKLPGETLTLNAKITNALKSPLNLAQLELVSTSHLKFAMLKKICLNAASDNQVTFSAQLSHRGPAAICAVLVQFVGPAELFKAEISLPRQHNIDLLAQLPFRAASKRKPLAHPAGDPEFDRIRPFAQGDALNRIFWRGYAKTGELMTRVFVPEPTTRHIAILLDATPAMVTPKSTDDAPLFERLPEIAQLALSADEITFIACTSNAMRTYASKQPPHTLCRVLDQFSIGATLFNTNFAMRAWPLVSRKLWYDLAYSHSLDFSLTQNGKTLINTPQMIQWIRAYLVQTHPNLATRLIKISDAAIASFYMRERRIELSLPEQTQQPHFALALKYLATLRADVRPQEIFIVTPNNILPYTS